MRLIDADALIEQMEADAEHLDNAISKMMYYAAISDVKHASTIEPERKTGRWIETNPQNSEICRLINCSECGKGYIVNISVPYEDWTDAHKFCVECGAKMEREMKI